MLIKKKRGWEIPERDVTPEGVWLSRRQMLRSLGFAGVGLGTLLAGGSWARTLVQRSRRIQGIPEAVRFPDGPAAELYPAERNPRFGVEDAGRDVTPPELGLAYNNFYEFFTDKSKVWELVERFETQPWQVRVHGLVEEPTTFDLDDLVRSMPLEERVYRFRCVEAWSATIPWTGFPFGALLDRVRPLDRARYVRMVTVMRPDQMPGIPGQSWYPWPYQEGLTIEEARNELTMLVTGAYGKPLPKQNGAPIRLMAPWKFGFKNIKSIVEIELTAEQPKTLWSTVTPNEYGFWANINPEVSHPRWSQASETLIDTGERIPTQLFNGYGEWVAPLYENLEEEYGIWLYR